ncbi:MAG: ABC transporter substrate-binding protein [Actinomycetes bacterium]
MWSQKDRLLAGMFAAQLVAALVFGAVLVSGLSQPVETVQVDATALDGGAGGGSTPGDVGTSAGADGADTGTDGAVAEPGATSGAAGTTPDGSGSATGGEDAGGGDTAGGQPSSAGGATGTSGGTTRAAGTGGAGIRTGVTDDAVKVGVLVTQTGAINFRSSAQATKAYLDMVNEAGGVNGRRIDYIIKDDGLDENKGLQAVQEMLNAGVFSFVAFNAPLTEQSVLPVLDENTMPLIGAFAIPAHRYGYLFSAPYFTYGVVGGETLCQQDVTRPGLVYLSNQVESTDRTIRESWRKGLADTCGVTLADDDIFGVEVTKADFSDVVTQLQLNGVDGIGTILDATAMVRLQQALNRQGYRPTHVSSPFGGDPAVLRDRNVGTSFEGLFVLSDVEFLGSSAPEVRRYEAEVSRRFGGKAELNWAGQHGWLGARIFVEALEEAGPDPTRERLLAAMNSFRDLQTGFTPPLTITEALDTHNASNRCMKVGRVVNGKVQQLRDFTCPPLPASGSM